MSRRSIMRVELGSGCTRLAAAVAKGMLARLADDTRHHAAFANNADLPRLRGLADGEAEALFGDGAAARAGLADALAGMRQKRRRNRPKWPKGAPTRQFWAPVASKR